MDARVATLEEILPLRQAVIIDGTDRESPYFAGDFDASTRHVGVFEQGRCLACATFVRSEFEDKPAWQLRGMATAPELQRRGIGRALLRFAEELLASQSALRAIWCNARLPAVPFYEKLGWTAITEVYVIEGVGPHRKMVRTLP